MHGTDEYRRYTPTGLPFVSSLISYVYTQENTNYIETLDRFLGNLMLIISKFSTGQC